MSTTANTPRFGQFQAPAKRVFSRGNDDPPDPVYANVVDFTLLGLDVFMDVGVVAPESIQATMKATAKSDPAIPQSVDVHILYRFGISLQTAMQLHKRLTEIINATQSQLQAAAAAAQKAQPKEGD